MSKVLGMNKSDKKSIFIVSKDNDFYSQITKILLNLGLQEHNLPVNFPCNISPPEESAPDLTKESDFYEQTRDTDVDLTIVYGKDKIFLILACDEAFMKKFNEEFNKNFSF